MRWLFLIVLTINLAYIGWQVNHSGSGDYTDVPPLKGVAPIVLLAELDAGEYEADETPVHGDNEAVTGARGDSMAAISVTQQVPAVAGPGQPVQVEAAAAETGTEVEEAEVAATTEEEPEVSASEGEKVAVVKAEPVAVKNSCYTLGPFRDIEKLRLLTREIKPYVISADFRGREKQGAPIYWVYIKPEKTHSKAIAVGNRLKKNGISDYYVIRDGDKIHGVSLGHFRNKQGAERLVKRVKKLGFRVVLETLEKSYTVYWLDYELISDAEVPEAAIDKLMKDAKKDKITRLERNCNVQAGG